MGEILSGIREVRPEPTTVEKPYWSVTVSINGEPVLTIEPCMLAGIPDIDQYADQIREAGQHLVGFAGPENYHDPFLEGLLAEETATSALENGPASLADAHSKPDPLPEPDKEGYTNTAGDRDG